MSESDTVNFRRIPLEVFNEGRYELIDELVAKDFVEHVPLPPGMPEGTEGLRAFVQAIRAAFPDFRYSIKLQLRDGDMHVGYIQASGTMSGDFMGMPASGKAATWDEVHIGRYSGGKLVEHWAVVDQLGMLQQLGFAPVPGAG